ncbi:MAG: hypothetical protein H9Q65_01640 [Spiroplasma ixodetis]|nr:hypothetical protein [Spiroplasma ixodetis]MBP1526740.1 hypothetical protein [Spiroplasma ixodetis]MBP1527948.1 hypothetical protein [Spiroplasma ixodetis]
MKIAIFFFYNEQKILSKLKKISEEKDKELEKLTNENNNTPKIILLSSNILELRSKIWTLEEMLEKKITIKIEQLEKSKINKYKNFFINFFTFWIKDKNKCINNKINKINSDYTNIKNNCKELENHLIDQINICKNLKEKKWKFSEPNPINKEKKFTPKI